jgi:hypothetical protein
MFISTPKKLLMIEQVLNILCNFLNIIKIFPHCFVDALSMISNPLKDQTIKIIVWTSIRLKKIILLCNKREKLNRENTMDDVLIN